MSGLGNGYWINYETNDYYLIDSHERWLRSHYDKFNIDPFNFLKFKEDVDRQQFLTYILNSYPLIRVREHGSEITFEFSTDNINVVMWCIYYFLIKIDVCGDYTGLNLINLNKKAVYILWKDFFRKMKNCENIFD